MRYDDGVRKKVLWFFNAIAGNAIWSGLQMLWALGGGALLASLVGGYQAFKHNFDWVTVFLTFVVGVVMIAFAERRGAQAPNKTSTSPVKTVLALVDVFPVCRDEDNVFHKSKLCIFFRNEADRPLEIGPPWWCADASGIPPQSPFGYRFQVEGRMRWAYDEWLPEVENITVLPGQVFKLWIGLGLDAVMMLRAREAEIRRRLHNKQLGKLEIVAKLSGESIKLVIPF